MWFAAKQQTIDGILKKTVQTSDAKSVPFLPVSKAYLLSFQRIGSKNKRPDIVCYTTTRKYRELQLTTIAFSTFAGYTTTRKYRELQHLSSNFRTIFGYTTTRKYRELQLYIRRCCSNNGYTTTRKYRELQPRYAARKGARGYTTTRKYRELQLPVS